MSYDLDFSSRDGRLSRDAFQRYFSGRPLYEVRSLERDTLQAVYANEATGVDFSFTWANQLVSLAVSYLRPHFFALESELEVTAFVRAFGPQIDDPQSQGMGKGPYSAEGYLRGWNTGNRFAYQGVAAAGDHESTKWRLPRAVLEEMWSWNFNHGRTQGVMRESQEHWFVPRIVLIDGAARPRSAIAWSGDVMTLVPAVDAILAADFRVIALTELEGLLSKYPRQTKDRPIKWKNDTWPLGMNAWAVGWSGDAPADLATALATLGSAFSGRGIPWRRVLTEEVFA